VRCDAVGRERPCPVCDLVFAPPESARSVGGGAGGQITAAIPAAQRKEAIVTALTDDPAAFNEATEERDPNLRDMKDVLEAEERMDFCWRRCKAGAKLGAALGCVFGLATLALDRDSGLLGTLVAALGVSIVGGAHGLLIGALAHSIGTTFRAWIEVGLIGV